MASITIYHNPRCSKSRAALALLREKGIEPTVVEYLKTPPSVDAVRWLLGMLGLAPRELVRPTEAKAAGIDPASADDQALISAIAANPSLMERPIVVAGNAARIGRPPERILELLESDR